MLVTRLVALKAARFASERAERMRLPLGQTWSQVSIPSFGEHCNEDRFEIDASCSDLLRWRPLIFGGRSMQLRHEKDMTKQWLLREDWLRSLCEPWPEDEAVQCSELRRSSMTVFASPHTHLRYTVNKVEGPRPLNCLNQKKFRVRREGQGTGKRRETG